MPLPDSLTIVVPQELAGARIDVLIPRLAPVSRRAARRLIEDGAVFLNGKRTQVCSRTAEAGARIEVAMPRDRAPPVVLPDWLFIDEHLVVVNKPGGVPTEPTREGSRGTLLVALRTLLRERGEATDFLHAAHRLDTDTTGVVAFARSPRAAAVIGEQLQTGTADRRYLALVAGSPPWAEVQLDQPLSRTRDDKGRVFVDPDGLPSVTRVRVLAPATTASLALCTAVTGRTHQLRVHLAEAGHALVGDRRYGKGRDRQQHLGLHALTLGLVHPEGRRVEFFAPPPEAFLAAAEAHGLERGFVARVAEDMASGDAPPPVAPAGRGTA